MKLILASNLRLLPVFVINVTSNFSNVNAFWSKQVSVARNMAIWFPFMLSMASSTQCLLAPLTAQARPMPVSAQGHHLLRKINHLPTARAERCFSSKSLHIGWTSWSEWLGCLSRCPGCSRRALSGTFHWFIHRSMWWSFVNIRTRSSNINTFGSKQCSIAWLVAIWHPIVLGMVARRQSLVTAFTFQTKTMPVLPKGAHFFSEIDRFLTSGTLRGHLAKVLSCNPQTT